MGVTLFEFREKLYGS